METQTVKALQLIRTTSIGSPTQFARLMWADNPAWRHNTKCGHGTTKGGGMKLAGGGFLGRLRRKGYINNVYPVRLTEQGKALLAAQQQGDAE